MSVGLAWRLLWSGIATEHDVESALREQLTGSMSFVRALLLQSPNVSGALERQLGEKRDDMIVDEGLARRLPPGACATLLAVPVGRDAGGAILVATADPLDRHAAYELEYHLGEPVKLVRAPLDWLLATLPAPSQARTARVEPARSAEHQAAPPPRKGGTPMHGTPLVSARSSEAPIPLVRVASSVPATTTVPSPPLDENAVTLEPRRSSFSSRPPPKPVHAAALDPREAVSAFSRAQSADEVVSLLVEGSLPVAAAVAAFVIRGNAFVGRFAGGAIDGDVVRALSVPLDRPSILKTAGELGHYLGPIPETEAHRGLLDALRDVPGEVSVHAASVAGRPAVVLVLSGLRNPYVATGRVEELMRAAGGVLEGLLRTRRR